MTAASRSAEIFDKAKGEIFYKVVNQIFVRAHGEIFHKETNDIF
jgi:hypothetical protein